mgnify:CR=1 FL=1
MCMACVTKMILRTCALARMSAENLAFCSVLSESPSVHFTGVCSLFSRWFLMAAASPSPPDASTGKPVWRCNRAASNIDALRPVSTTMACAVFACGAEKRGPDRSSSAANNKLPDLLMKNMAQTISANVSTQQSFKRPLPIVRSIVNFIQLTFDKSIILPLCCRRWHSSLTNPWANQHAPFVMERRFFLKPGRHATQPSSLPRSRWLMLQQPNLRDD